MSEDEDEELAFLRLQALMSKRRGGAAASKDLLPFPLPLTLEPKATASTEPPMTIPSVVVTSAPSAVTDPPAQVISNKAGMHQQPLRGRAS